MGASGTTFDEPSPQTIIALRIILYSGVCIFVVRTAVQPIHVSSSAYNHKRMNFILERFHTLVQNGYLSSIVERHSRIQLAHSWLLDGRNLSFDH